VWWLLAAVLLALAIGVPLQVRARRRGSWQQKYDGVTADATWLARELLPELRGTGSRDQAAGGWAVSSDRVVTAEDRLTTLVASAPGDPERVRATTLRDALRSARSRIGQVLDTSPEETFRSDLDQVVVDLEAVLAPPAPAAT
jgi:hypothetical protein